MSENAPAVGIVMGSDSDLPDMRAACEVLEKLDVPFEVRIISAHRWPSECHDYATTAETRGLRVLIAGAGGAAHLAGVLASMTPLPVIGVPIASSALNGVDALHATVQMPPGVPVATVGVGGACNAAVLAVQILGAGDADWRAAVTAYKRSLAETVQQRDRQLQEQGWRDYAPPQS